MQYSIPFLWRQGCQHDLVELAGNFQCGLCPLRGKRLLKFYLFFLRQETKFQKSVAVLSPGNNPILDENWLHEQRGCLKRLPGLWEQIQQVSEPLLISYMAQPVFLYFAIRPRQISVLFWTHQLKQVFFFILYKKSRRYVLLENKNNQEQ